MYKQAMSWPWQLLPCGQAKSQMEKRLQKRAKNERINHKDKKY